MIINSSLLVTLTLDFPLTMKFLPSNISDCVYLSRFVLQNCKALVLFFYVLLWIQCYPAVMTIWMKMFIVQNSNWLRMKLTLTVFHGFYSRLMDSCPEVWCLFLGMFCSLTKTGMPALFSRPHIVIPATTRVHGIYSVSLWHVDHILLLAPVYLFCVLNCSHAYVKTYSWYDLSK